MCWRTARRRVCPHVTMARIGARDTARMAQQPSLGRGEQDDRYAEAEGAHLQCAGAWLAVCKRLRLNPVSDGALRMARCAGRHRVARHRRKRSTNCRTGISSEASGVRHRGRLPLAPHPRYRRKSPMRTSKRVWRSRRSPQRWPTSRFVCWRGVRWRMAVHCVVSASSFGRRPIVPRSRYAGGEFAWLPISCLSSARWALGEPMFRVTGCRREVPLMPGLFCELCGLTHILCS